MTRTGAVVAGHICLDIIPQLPVANLQTVVEPGAVLEIGAAVMSTGGAVSNTGLNLHTLGIPTQLMAKVGDDQFGQIILDLMRGHDPALAANIIVAPGEVSSYTIVLSPKETDRAFLHCSGANNTFGADDVLYEQLESARLFHFGYPPVMRRIYADDGAELVAICQRAKEMGVLTSLDMAKPDPNGPSGQVNWQRIIERVLPHVDLFMPSLDELLFMMRRDVFDSGNYDDRVISKVATEMIALGTGVVALKLGDRGLYLRTGNAVPDALGAGWHNRELWVPCFVPQPLVGTTGAGDATIAGFLAAILHGQSVEDLLTSAVAVGACNVEASDALSGVQPWDATQARIVAGWPRATVTPNAPGWTFDAARALWIGPNDSEQNITRINE